MEEEGEVSENEDMYAKKSTRAREMLAILIDVASLLYKRGIEICRQNLPTSR